jgi:hypothetical protein
MSAILRPIPAALMGALMGVITVGLLWQLGIVAPERLTVFGMPAMVAALTVWALAPGTVKGTRPGKVVIVAITASTLVALSGIPAYVGGGAVTPGCALTAEGLIDSRTPAQTSASRPFALTSNDLVSWTVMTPEVWDPWQGAVGLEWGGARVPLWNPRGANANSTSTWSGTIDVGALRGSASEATSLPITGIYHVFGSLDSPQGRCVAHGYIRIAPGHPFDGPVLQVLWTLWISGGLALTYGAHRAAGRGSALPDS